MTESFDKAASSMDWRTINDGVMGGKSSGGPSVENGHMVFKGSINTDGGGFSSVRADVTPGQFKDASGMTFRVKSDGRDYKITLRTDERYRLRPVSFQIPIPQISKGDWSTVTVRFDDVKASVFGRSVSGTTFDRANIKELGIIIADGKDGAFRFDVDSIKAYSD